MKKRDSNPYELKTHEEAPSNYLSAEELINYFNSHDIPFERSDNLPRFCDNNKIKMIKLKDILLEGKLTEDSVDGVFLNTDDSTLIWVDENGVIGNKKQLNEKGLYPKKQSNQKNKEAN